MSSRIVRNVFTVLFALALSALAPWGLGLFWTAIGGGDLPLHGWIAMGLAAVFVLALGGGLMWLAFYSSRHGYDDDQGRDGP